MVGDRRHHPEERTCRDPILQAGRLRLRGTKSNARGQKETEPRWDPGVGWGVHALNFHRLLNILAEQDIRGTSRLPVVHVRCGHQPREQGASVTGVSA